MKENKCDVIVTYCWNRVGYNILLSLSKKGLKVWAADTSKRNICSLSKFCAGSFIYPNPFTDERAFILCLKQKIAELNPVMLLPTHDESQIIMRYREEFPSSLIIPYMDEECLRKMSDKAWATNMAERCGIPIPRLYKTWEDVDHYPCVIKTVIGNSAKTVFFPRDATELKFLAEKYAGVSTLIEEKVAGGDYSVDCIRWNDFFFASTYMALVTKTDGGGTTTQRKIVSVSELEKYAKILLDYIDFKGVCGIDFRYDPSSGTCAFIEINVRFTGGIATPIAAGFDIPWVLYSLATKNQYVDSIHLKYGTSTKWILGDIITIVGRLCSMKFNRQELKQALRYKGFDAYDDYRSDDKRAILGEMIYYLGKLVRNGKLNP